MNLVFFRNAHKISGAETYNLSLLQEFVKKKNLHISFVSDNADLLNRIKSFGVFTYQFPVHLAEVGTKRELLKALLILPRLTVSYLQLRKRVKRNEEAITWVLQSRTEKLFLSPLLRIFGDTVVWLEHGPFFASASSSIVTFLFKLVSRYAHEIIAVSNDTKRDLVLGGIRASKIHVIYIGVDTGKLRPASSTDREITRKRLRIDRGASVVGYLGTVSDEKGVEEFIQIADELIEKSVKWHFLVIGDGPKLEWAKEKVKKKNISKHFTFTGYTHKPEGYLSAIDVLLFPTKHREGISMAILEAQALGIPVIATDIGGNSEIIDHGKNGFLFKMNDVDAAVKSSIHVVGATKVLPALKKNARKNIEARFDIRKQGQIFYEYFKKL